MKNLKIRFLGTGTSTGIPQIGCNCDTCNSSDQKDKRLRASVILEYKNSCILIDAGPDLRQQLLTSGTKKIDAILITHEHYDHIGGLDDIRPLGHTHIFAEKRALKIIKTNMPYCFAENKYPGVPLIELNEISTENFKINQVEINPIRVMHAQLPVLGFRFDNVAYLTDVKTIDDENLNKLRQLDILIINALRHTTHISHISLNECLAIVKKLNPRMTYLTHLSHDMGKHNDIEKLLPENIRIAYDNLVLNL